MVAGISLEGHARKGRFPGLVNCLKTRCRPAGVGHDSATCQIEEINGSSKLIGLRRLPAPLSGRNHRHDRIAAKQRLKACFDGLDYRLIRLPELVLQSINMD